MRENATVYTEKRGLLHRKYLTNLIIYRLLWQPYNNASSATHIGLTENSYQTRYSIIRLHLITERRRQHRNKQTCVEAERAGNNIYMTLSGALQPKPNLSTNRCWLCTAEKICIILQHDKSALNEQRELVIRWHWNKHLFWRRLPIC